jgi:hypothetical protein
MITSSTLHPAIANRDATDAELGPNQVAVGCVFLLEFGDGELTMKPANIA